ncbi:6681_t:CDS:2, partial [Acaulospora colombiana]
GSSPPPRCTESQAVSLKSPFPIQNVTNLLTVRNSPSSNRVASYPMVVEWQMIQLREKEGSEGTNHGNGASKEHQGRENVVKDVGDISRERDKDIGGLWGWKEMGDCVLLQVHLDTSGDVEEERHEKDLRRVDSRDGATVGVYVRWGTRERSVGTYEVALLDSKRDSVATHEMDGVKRERRVVKGEIIATRPFSQWLQPGVHNGKVDPKPVVPDTMVAGGQLSSPSGPIHSSRPKRQFRLDHSRPSISQATPQPGEISQDGVSCVRLKGLELAYETVYVAYSDIAPLWEKLGLSPVDNGPNQPTSTLPVISVASENGGPPSVVADSFNIALFLDHEFPDTPRVIPDNTAALQASFARTTLRDLLVFPLAPLVMLTTHQRLDDRCARYFRETREKSFGVKLEELSPPGEKREARLKAAQKALTTLSEIINTNGSRRDTWFMGDVGPTFADFAMGGTLHWIREMGDEELW